MDEVEWVAHLFVVVRVGSLTLERNSQKREPTDLGWELQGKGSIERRE
jgi:hypothetical protein